MADFQMTGSESDPKSWSLEPGQAPSNGSHNPWKYLVLGKWPNCDNILAWFLYQLGLQFLVSADLNAVREVLEILRPLDQNLAALLLSKIDH